MTATDAPANGLASSRALRPSAKVLPEHARGHNRSLVLQTLYRNSGMSRADLARATGLTRVTIGDLVADLIADALVVELGQRDEARPGKPATLLDVDRSGHGIVGIDLSDHTEFRGSLLDLSGTVVLRRSVSLDGATGEAAGERAVALARELAAAAATPVLGVGVGTPGIVDQSGRVLTAPNLGWADLPLRDLLAAATGLPVFVSNDANVAALAEHSFGGSRGDLMVVTVGHGVGAGLIIDGRAIVGSRSAAGEIGHVVVGTDPGPACACGKRGCLEAWLAVPRLEAAIADGDRDSVLEEAGRRLGIALAPVVGALNLAEVVLSGPAHLLDGRLRDSAVATLRGRTLDELHGDLDLRMSALGTDIVMRGAAALVLSGRLGVA